MTKREDLKTFFHVVFSGCTGLIPFRSFPEGESSDSTPHNIWVKADDNVVDSAMTFAQWTDRSGMGFFVIPGTVESKGEASAEHIKQMQVLLIDIDTGDIDEKLRLLTDTIGQPTMVVESGGMTDEGQKKLHVYWQLEKAVSGDDLKKLVELRYQIALLAGGDLHFKSPHQPIRVAGSMYHKRGSKNFVKIQSYEPNEYSFDELASRLNNLTKNCAATYTYEKKKIFAAQSDDIMDFNNAPVKNEEILTSKVYAGGEGENTRFCALQRVVGYWLRRAHEGLINNDKAWEEIAAYNEANVVPPWPEDRLRELVNGLWRKHVKENGEVKKVDEQPSMNIEAIDPTSWQGEAPEREWLIEGWLPRGYVTAIYGDGGVGKSLLAQQIMTALATGQNFMGFDLPRMKVYALMCEDDENELWRRQSAINEHYGISMNDLGNVRLVSRVGMDNLLMVFAGDDVGKLTKFYNCLLDDILQHNPDLVILDTAADLFGGNENNRPQVRQFIQAACGGIARATNSAVLLCAHPSESGIQKGTGSGGSTAWNNTVRSRWYLKRPDDGMLTNDHRVLSKVKSNYSSKGDEQYLLWKDGAFIHVDPMSVSIPITGKTQIEKNTAERERKNQTILHLIESEAAQGRVYTMNQFAETFEDSKCNSYGLGSKRSINERLSVIATCGLVSFFDNPREYGFSLKKTRYGYLCTDNTRVKISNTVDEMTGEVEEELIQIVPTHHKLQLNGELVRIENNLN